MSTAVITVEGVLKAHTGDRTLPAGQLLYHSLQEVMRVVLVTSGEDVEPVDHWLKVNGLRGHVLLLPADFRDPLDDGVRRLRQVAKIRETGPVEFVVEPDPHVAEHLLRNGVATLLYTHPQYTAPEHRPDADREIKPWSSFVDEIDREQALRASDGRVE